MIYYNEDSQSNWSGIFVSPDECLVPISEVSQNIDTCAKLHQTSNIIFDFRSEGYQKQIIHFMNDVSENLVTKFGYDINMFLYHSGAFGISSNLKWYNELPFNFLPKNIFLETVAEVFYYNKTINRKVIINSKPKKFLSMNGVPRTVRRLATKWLLERDLIKESFYSLDVNSMACSHPNYLLEKYDNVVNPNSVVKGPMILSKDFKVKDDFDRIKQEDIYYFDNSYFSIVQETFYDNMLDSSTDDIAFYECMFITEKTFRPIYFKHPFVMLGVSGSLAALRERGYKTFSPYIDESYDDIIDPVLRFETVMKEVKRLCSLTDDEWLTIQLGLYPIVEYNYKVLTDGTTTLLGKRK